MGAFNQLMFSAIHAKKRAEKLAEAEKLKAAAEKKK